MTTKMKFVSDRINVNTPIIMTLAKDNLLIETGTVIMDFKVALLYSWLKIIPPVIVIENGKATKKLFQIAAI